MNFATSGGRSNFELDGLADDNDGEEPQRIGSRVIKNLRGGGGHSFIERTRKFFSPNVVHRYKKVVAKNKKRYMEKNADASSNIDDDSYMYDAYDDVVE